MGFSRASFRLRMFPQVILTLSFTKVGSGDSILSPLAVVVDDNLVSSHNYSIIIYLAIYFQILTSTLHLATLIPDRAHLAFLKMVRVAKDEGMTVR